MIKDRLIYTVDETSRLLKLSRGATYEAIRRGQIFSIRIGRRILVPRVALEKLLQRGQGACDGDL